MRISAIISSAGSRQINNLAPADVEDIADVLACHWAGRWERPAAAAAELPTLVAAHLDYDDEPEAAETLRPGLSAFMTRLESLTLSQRLALVDLIERRFFPAQQAKVSVE